MANLLRAHWGKVSARQEIDHQLLERWLSRLKNKGCKLPPPSDRAWTVTRDQIELAVKHSGDGMPGLDRVPYQAWRNLGSLGIDILHVAMVALASNDALELLKQACAPTDGTGPQCHDFNLGILCCLPKKASGVDHERFEYHDAVATRPLSLLNTDNRLLASAARLTWEPLFNDRVSQLQRGVLKGRSLIRNVVDVD